MRFGGTVGLLLRGTIFGVGLTTAGAAGSPPVPVIALSGTHSIPENAAVGTVVGVASVAWATSTYAWTLMDAGPGSHIGITDLGDGTAQIKVASNINFETQPSIDIQLLATPPSGPTVFATITITIADVYEAPDVEGAATILLALGML